VNFNVDTSVIARVGARLQYEDPTIMAGGRFYLGVSAVKDLAGDSSSTLQSIAFAGGLPKVISAGFQETAAQFSGGFDVNLSRDTRLFADANYLIGEDTEAFRGSGGVAIKW
jgi:Autotransporter beta-domain